MQHLKHKCNFYCCHPAVRATAGIWDIGYGTPDVNMTIFDNWSAYLRL